ncbi:class I SAM-dependent methyltransferase [Candidatus Gottesmanbacteria bacterium]|nr:class I SAM-dependent methyltransferase [Candidatus Gottesmanbacteria bacterium]
MNTKQIWDSIGDFVGPTIFHPQYFRKIGEYRCLEMLKKEIKGSFLDIGCGRQWYRDKIEKYVSKYYALDHPKSSKLYKSRYPVGILSNAEKIPLPSIFIDTALLLTVLEHLANPTKVLKEINRILKKNGKVIICTVENYPSHNLPLNYFRFTKFGLSEILTENGFKEAKIISYGNFWETQAVYQNVYMMELVKYYLGKRNMQVLGLFLLVIFAPIIISGNIAAIILGARKATSEFAIGHIVVASK